MKKYKKDISRFLNSEEGKILNADIVKLGVTLGIIGVAVSDADIVVGGTTNTHRNYFQHNKSSHTNYSYKFWGYHINYSVVVPANSHYSHVAHNSHGSHGSHGSHSSHGSHARGGWC
jgi:hypothetical protein